MIKFLEGTNENALALEIIGKYEVADEKAIEQKFEECLDKGYEKVNLLVKIDSMKIVGSSLKAMWDDGIYAIKHIKHCGRIAVVGDSKVEEFLVKMDNAMFGSKKAGRLEKYFFADELEKALDFVNEK
nr:STAS/SEC14 domain-containing protein [Bacteroidota bacterium]